MSLLQKLKLASSGEHEAGFRVQGGSKGTKELMGWNQTKWTQKAESHVGYQSQPAASNMMLDQNRKLKTSSAIPHAGVFLVNKVA